MITHNSVVVQKVVGDLAGIFAVSLWRLRLFADDLLSDSRKHVVALGFRE